MKYNAKVKMLDNFKIIFARERAGVVWFDTILEIYLGKYPDCCSKAAKFY